MGMLRERKGGEGGGGEERILYVINLFGFQRTFCVMLCHVFCQLDNVMFGCPVKIFLFFLFLFFFF